MPDFLDLLMIFGKQSRAQHFHQSAFRHRTRLSNNGFKKSCRGLEISELGWSGHDLQVCYNLKSVERSSQGDWPWSIRDCAVDHSFDVESVRIIWIIIKGDSLVQDRIQSATTDPNTAEMSSFKTLGRAFASTLMTHLLICEWVSENWDQYLVFIETKSYGITRGIMSDKIDLQPQIVKEPRVVFPSKPERTATGISARSVVSSVAHARTRLFQSQDRPNDREKRLPNPSLEAGLKQPIPSGINETIKAEIDFRGQKEFRFNDLQELQYVLDKINEALLVLELDMDGLSQLLQYYEVTLSSVTFPQGVARDCDEEFHSFRSQLNSHINHLHNCLLRFRTLADSVSNSMKLVRSPVNILVCC